MSPSIYYLGAGVVVAGAGLAGVSALVGHAGLVGDAEQLGVGPGQLGDGALAAAGAAALELVGRAGGQLLGGELHELVLVDGDVGLDVLDCKWEGDKGLVGCLFTK